MSYYKVIYDKLFPYAPYLNERIGIEILVETGQSPQDALLEAKTIVEAFYKEQSLANRPPETTTITIPESQQEIQVQKEIPKSTSLIDDINSCTEVKVLESYKFIVRNKPELQAAYDLKLKTLQS